MAGCMFSPDAPVTGVEGGLVFVEFDGRKIYATRAVARKFAECLIRQLNAADRESAEIVLLEKRRRR